MTDPLQDQGGAQPRRLVLASSSRFRAELLNRLGLRFQTLAPDIDESRVGEESPQALVARLSLAKAKAVCKHAASALVVGSDQVGLLGEQVLNKPGSVDAAVKQLLAASGHSVVFLTGLCLLDTETGNHQVDVVTYRVLFRHISPEEAACYVQREMPLDCAGSFRAEGLGIALFREMQGADPTALLGLPLIRLCEMLRLAGLDPLAPQP